MKNLTLENIAAAAGGSFHGNAGDARREITEVVTDSRQASPGLSVYCHKG